MILICIKWWFWGKATPDPLWGLTLLAYMPHHYFQRLFHVICIWSTSQSYQYETHHRQLSISPRKITTMMRDSRQQFLAKDSKSELGKRSGHHNQHHNHINMKPLATSVWTTLVNLAMQKYNKDESSSKRFQIRVGQKKRRDSRWRKSVRKLIFLGGGKKMRNVFCLRSRPARHYLLGKRSTGQ